MHTTFNPGTPVAVDLTDTAASIASLATAAGVPLPQTMGGVIISAPDSAHAKGANAGAIFVGDATAQHLCIPQSRVEGVLYYFKDPTKVYLKSSAASGDAAIILPLL